MRGNLGQVGYPRRPGAGGLSPRVRGNLGQVGVGQDCRGSIPACAGEPVGVGGLILHHPRVCGGTVGIGGCRVPRRVYPRVCGGTIRSAISLRRCCGLSPRVRGNPRLDQADGALAGSIPACAGEPAVVRNVARMVSVYPRVCGGTGGMFRSNLSHSGLSPRVRGNPLAPTPPRQRRRSIPACAGEPFNGSVLIERVRSIPACAGEPRMPQTPGSRNAVYPRVCGGTLLADASLDAVGSIPACAGEPCQPSFHLNNSPVYPRVCGGTSSIETATYEHVGLSPRVRGNLGGLSPRVRGNLGRIL